MRHPDARSRGVSKLGDGTLRVINRKIMAVKVKLVLPQPVLWLILVIARIMGIVQVAVETAGCLETVDRVKGHPM